MAVVTIYLLSDRYIYEWIGCGVQHNRCAVIDSQLIVAKCLGCVRSESFCEKDEWYVWENIAYRGTFRSRDNQVI